MLEKLAFRVRVNPSDTHRYNAEEAVLKLLLSTGEENLIRGKEFQVEPTPSD